MNRKNRKLIAIAIKYIVMGIMVTKVEKLIYQTYYLLCHIGNIGIRYERKINCGSL